MAFPDSFIQELVERNDIADVVSAYLRLTKRSGSNQFGLCPFHNEKTPSFSVSTDKQIYHCFGCGKGGGVINFIMEVENLSYPDAVHFLARRVGLQVPEDRPDPKSERRKRMLELNRDAAKLFYEQLKAPSGVLGVQYIRKRGMNADMVKRFGLGVAPDSWDFLVKEMLQRGYTKPELIDAGLARPSKRGDGGVYDTFRNRLMFPVIDVRGSVIGFSGRILDDGEPKYMNSPETLVFNKSRNLFGLNLAKKSKKGYIILAEGNIDVVALHQAGFDSAVASLGTSLTAEQARLMASYVREVVIAYDSDSAGLKAAHRAIGILEQLDIKVKVLRMSGAKDPDEFIVKYGSIEFEKLISRSENHLDFRLTEISSRHNLALDEDRLAFIQEAMEFAATLSSKVAREVYSMKIADMGKISGESVIGEVERLRRRAVGKAKKKYEADATRPVRAAQPRHREIRYDNIKSATAEEGVIRLLCAEPELFADVGISSEEFSSPLLAGFFTALTEQVERNNKTNVSLLAELFSSDEISHLTEILGEPIEPKNNAKALADYIDIIKIENLARNAGRADSGQALNEMAKRLKARHMEERDNGR